MFLLPLFVLAFVAVDSPVIHDNQSLLLLLLLLLFLHSDGGGGGGFTILNHGENDHTFLFKKAVFFYIFNYFS